MHNSNIFKRTVHFRDSDFLYVDSAMQLDSETSSNTENFSEKWKIFYQSGGRKAYDEFQEKWFESLYGKSRREFLSQLKSGSLILDAGCGGGDKTQNMGLIATDLNFWGADLSVELGQKATEAREIKNVRYIRSDIANLPFCDEMFDVVICDQVLHHTKDPNKTLMEFSRLLKKGGVLLTYVYQKKPLPRELLDQHFIDSENYTKDQLLEMSKQLTILGEFLQKNFPGEVDFPPIELLGIKSQKKSLQRYIYDNFIKCFFNEQIGSEQSMIVNFDWYVPNIAYRYTQKEFTDMCTDCGFHAEYLYVEPSCISGRFIKVSG